MTMSMSVRSKNNARERCCFPPSRKIESSSPRPIIHCADKYRRRWNPSVAVAAVVVTMIAAIVVLGVPVALMVAGVKVHVASEGRPTQARLIIPLKLVELATVTDEVPVPPGVEIKTCEALVGIEAKKAGVIVKVIGAVLALALKLLSPL